MIKRTDERQHTTAQVDIVDFESGVEFSGAAQNVSAHGLKFHAGMEPPIGAELAVRVGDERSNMQVTRVEACATGGYDVAGRLTPRR
jgi:hypothetical protein